MKGKSYEELMEDSNFAELSNKIAEYERLETVKGLAEARRLIREMINVYGDEMNSSTKQRCHENSARLLSTIGDSFSSEEDEEEDDNSDIITISIG